MTEKEKAMREAELAAQRNALMLGGIFGGLPPVLAEPQKKEKDKVKEPPNQRRSREREER